MKKAFVLIPLILLSGCISAEEQQAAHYRLEQVLMTQCSETMGFKKGTTEYLKCRTFYETITPDEGFSSDYYGVGAVMGFEDKITEVNTHCTNLLGATNPKAGQIWPCVQEKHTQEVAKIKHDREMQEQQRLMTSSMEKAEADNRLQERILAERERVAAATGKKPQDVTCRTYYKSESYTQIKCK